jgi:hypothetical protein
LKAIEWETSVTPVSICFAEVIACIMETAGPIRRGAIFPQETLEQFRILLQFAGGIVSIRQVF